MQVPVDYTRVEPRTVDPTYQQTPQSTYDAEGGLLAKGQEQFAQGADQAGADLGDAAVRYQQQQNDVALKSADANLRNQISTIMYGDGTPQNPGFYSLRGEAAAAARPQVVQNMQQARMAVMAGLPSDHLRQVYDAVGQDLVNNEYNNVGRFAIQQGNVAADDASNARVDAATTTAANAWNDPQQLATSLAILHNETVQQGQRQGWDADTIAQNEQNQKAKLYNAVVSNITATGNYQAAQGFIDAHDADIPATIKPKLLGDIRTGMRIAKFDALYSLQMNEALAKANQQKLVGGLVDQHLKFLADPEHNQDVTPLQVANTAGVLPETKENFYSWMTAHGVGKTDDPATVAALHDGLMNGTLDLQTVFAASPKLTKATADQYVAYAKDVQNPFSGDAALKKAVDAADASLAPTLPGFNTKSGLGQRASSDFLMDFVPQYLKDKQTNPAQARKDLNFADKNSLINQVMAAHTVPMAAQISELQAIANSALNAPVAAPAGAPPAAAIAPAAAAPATGIPTDAIASPSGGFFSPSLNKHYDSSGKELP